MAHSVAVDWKAYSPVCTNQHLILAPNNLYISKKEKRLKTYRDELPHGIVNEMSNQRREVGLLEPGAHQTD